MSVLSWIRLTVCPWLPRRPARLASWLLLAVAGVAAWPVTAATAAGYAAAWLRGWPASRLGRQAGWTLPMAAVWIGAESARGWRAMALDPARDGASGWPHLTPLTVLRTFLLVAPVTIPAGLALAALLRAWRIYPIDTTRQEREKVADPGLIRGLETGQACDVHRGAATFVQAARPKASPLSLPAAQAHVMLPAPRRESWPAAGSSPPTLRVPPPPDLDHILGPGGAR